MAETIQQLLRERADDDTPGLLVDDRTWTWRQYVEEASVQASALAALAAPDRTLHVGVLYENGADLALAIAAGGIGGHVVAGINVTRRGDGTRQGRTPRGVPGGPDRSRAPASARRTRPRRRTRHRHCERGVGGDGRRRSRRAVDPSRGHGVRHLHADLHLGHERRSEGRAGEPLHGRALGGDALGEVRPEARRRLLPDDAAVPLQRRPGRLERRGERRRGHGRRQVQRHVVPGPTSVASAPST